MPRLVSQRHPRLSVSILSVDPNSYTVAKFELTMRTPIMLATADRAVHPDVLMVQTHKDIGQVAGTFTLRLVARRNTEHKTWAQIIKPGDYVEIRLANNWVVSPADETLVMRGFVDATTESKGETTDGSPSAYVEIQGRDYGKLLLRSLFVLYPSVNKYGVAYGSHITDWAAPELDLYHLPLAMVQPADFVNKIMALVTGSGDAAAGGHPSGIMPIPQGAPDFKISVGKSLDDFVIVNPTEAPYTGSVWNLLSYYQNAPYWEMFVTDDTNLAGEGAPTGDSGLQPQFVWRRSPYHNKDFKVAAQKPDANLIFPDVSVSLVRDVEQMGLTRTDEQAFSYFLCIPRIDNDMDEGWWLMFSPPQQWGGSAIWDQTITRWLGFAPLEAPLTLAPAGSAEMGSSTETTVAVDLSTNFKPVADEFSQWLADVYTRNYLYESGTITVKGNPALRIGRHLTIEETGQQLYIETVDHNFTVDPLGFHTTVGVTRGEWTKTPAYATIDDSQDLGLGAIGNPPPGPNPPPPGNNPSSPPIGDCKWISPAAGPCTQGFGAHLSPLEPAGGHQGIDIGVSFGPVYAVASGTVITLDTGTQGPTGTGLGNVIGIKLDGNNGKCGGIVIYGHLKTGSFLVTNGQHVTQGQQLATSGDAGATEGAHLHFEYRPNATTLSLNGATQVISDGSPIDPGPYIGLSC
jgi:murein DD-endopeptidase MepM/ murein hydrolase activator NlpD